ncbi:MAG: hypothetical protein LBR10_11860 [Prevotellaceae bacterium]|jgi:ABC-type phosphate transport system substrate-binding protein|nr:hypothetical protein [Prevotellaceae bacterium]
MNYLKYLQLSVFLFVASYISAQTQNVIYVKSAKFTSQLLEKWASEYTEKNPDIQIKWVGKDDGREATVDLDIILHESQDKSIETDIIYVARYALLPIVAKSNPLLSVLEKTKLNKDKLIGLYFNEDPFAEEPAGNRKIEKLKNQLTVYSGNGQQSGAPAFAAHFGFQPADLRGKRIAGDDIFLLNAIKRDSSGITFNNLTYVYDLNTRNLKSDIAILPLDVKKEYEEVLNSTDLDKTISLLEEREIDLIPVQRLGFAIKKNKNPQVNNFLKWILSEGQSINHSFGFLSLDSKTVSAQTEQLTEILLTYN